MAKSKTKGRKAKIPKRVAGVKVPKAVRKGPIGQFLTSNLGKEVLAGALVAAAGAGLKHESGRDSLVGQAVAKGGRALKGAGGKARHGGEQAVDQVAFAGSAVAYAVSEAAKAFTLALQVGPPEREEPAAPAAGPRTTPTLPATADSEDRPAKKLRPAGDETARTH